jgi:NAD(P)-dependent dehydrogenase (short-subunit alcohol dehydrogenase family)
MGFLDGQVALVTGGNRGIGRGIVEALAREGARVVLTARDRKHAEDAAREVGNGALGFACDVRAYDQVVQLFRDLDRAVGGLDILVNNAGIGIFGPVADMRPEDWYAVIETNLNGVFHCCHEAIPRMKQRGGGYIFNISSLAGKNPLVHGAAYNASKFGLNGFSEALMMEVRYDGIRVSYLMPGSVETDFGASPTRPGRAASKRGWALTPADVGQSVIDLLRVPKHALFSRVEMRPSQPPRR